VCAILIITMRLSLCNFVRNNKQRCIGIRDRIETISRVATKKQRNFFAYTYSVIAIYIKVYLYKNFRSNNAIGIFLSEIIDIIEGIKVVDTSNMRCLQCPLMPLCVVCVCVWCVCVCVCE